MSANFYDDSGKMVGVDMHKYWAAPPPPTGHVEREWPHGVACEFSERRQGLPPASRASPRRHGR